MSTNNIKFDLPDVSGGLDPITNLPQKDVGVPKFNLPEVRPGGTAIERQIESKYDIGTFPEQDLEQVREDEQGLGESIMYTAARIPLLTATSVGSAITGLGELVVNAGRAAYQQSWDPFFDTPLSDSYNNLAEGIKEQLPLYNSKEDERNNFLTRAFTDLDFWTNDVGSEAVPFLVGSYLTGAGASKLLQPLTKAAYASRLASATEGAMAGLEGAAADVTAANGLKTRGLAAIKNNIDKLTVSGISRATESIAEGLQTKNLVYEDLVNQVDEAGNRKYSVEDAQLQAAKAGMLVTGLNMLLMPLDYDQYSGWFKTFSKSRDALKMPLENRFISFAKHAGRNAFTEGILEEGLQRAMQEYSQKKYTGQYGPENYGAILGTLSEYLKGFGTKEGWDAMGVGAIVGGLFGGATQLYGDSAKSQKERYDNLSKLMADHDYLKQPMASFIEKDPETGEPTLSGTKILSTIEQMAKDGLLSDSMLTQLTNNYEEAYKTIDNMRFANWAFTHFEAGQGEQLMGKIDSLGDLDVKELLDKGILGGDMKNSQGKLVTPQDIAARYKDKALELEKLYNQVSSRFELPDRAHLKNVFDEAVLQKETGVSINKINDKIDALKATIAQKKSILGPEAANLPESPEERELKVLENRKTDLVNTMKDSYLRLDEWTNPEKIEARYKKMAEQQKAAAEDKLAKSLATKKAKDSNYKMSKQEATFYDKNKEKVDKYAAEEPTKTEEDETKDTVAPAILPKQGKLQKFGQSVELEYSAVKYDQGFPVFTVQNPDGTTIDYSSKEGWFAVESTQSDLGSKEVLRGGRNHFSNLFKYRLSAEKNILTNVKANLKKDDGSLYSEDEIIEMYPDAFPSHRANKALQEVLKRPDWKNHVNLKVDKKYPKTGEPFKMKSGLYGNRPELDFVLMVTNPNTGESHEVHHIENPYFYSYEDKDGNKRLVDFTSITLEQFNNLFALGYAKKQAATERDLDNLKRQWFDLKQFVDRVNTWYAENNIQGPVEIPKDWYTMGPSAALALIENPKAPLTPITEAPKLAGAPIVSAYTMQSVNGVDIPTDAPDLPNAKSKYGYYILFSDANGYKTWVRLSPKKILSSTEMIEKISSAQDALASIDPSLDKGTADEIAQNIIDELAIYIAVPLKKDFSVKVEFSAFRPQGTTKYFLQIESSIKTEQGTERGKIVFEQNGEHLKFNDPNKLADYLFNNKYKIGYINLLLNRSFRQDVPKGYTDPDAASKFDVITTADIIEPYTLSFKFGNELPDHMQDALGLDNMKPFQAQSIKPKSSEVLSDEQEIVKAEEALKDPNITDAERKNLVNKIQYYKNKLSKRKNAAPVKADPGVKAAAAQFTTFNAETALSEYVTAFMVAGAEPQFSDQFDVSTEEGIVKFLENEARTAKPEFAKVADELLNKLLGNKRTAPNVFVDPVDQLIENWRVAEANGKLLKIKTPGEGIDFVESVPDEVIKGTQGVPTEEISKAQAGFDVAGKTTEEIQNAIDAEAASRKKGAGMSFDYASQTGFTTPAAPFTVKQAAEFLKTVLPAGITVEEISALASNLGNGNIRYGYFKNNAIGLLNNAPRTIAFHEAFHGIFRAVLSDSQRNSYLNKIKSDLNLSSSELSRRIKALRATNPSNYAGLSNDEMADRVYEEVLADRYADWQEKRMSQKSVFQKLFDLIKRIADFFGLTNSIDALFRKIERGGFVKSNINPGYTESADKVIGLLSPIKSQEVVYVVAGTYFNNQALGLNTSIYDVLDNFKRLYDPESPNNKKLLTDRPDLIRSLNIYYNAFSNTDNRTLIKEQVDQIIAATKYNSAAVDLEDMDDDSGSAGSDSDRVHDKAANEYDPFEKLGAVVKRFFGTVTYQVVDEFGNVVVRSLDPKGVYTRLLPVLSASHTKRDQIMDKLQIMANVDPTVKAIYDKLIQVTGYSAETPKGVGNGAAFLSKFKNAFQVYQYLYTQTLINPGSRTAYTMYLNKTDVGKYAFERWENEFRQYILPKFKDAKFRENIVKGLNKGLTEFARGNKSEAAALVYDSLTKLKVTVDPDFVNISFEVPGTEGQKEMFPDVKFLDIETVMAIRDVVNNGVDLYAKGGGDVEAGVLTRLKNMASANAVFDLNVVLPTFKTPEGNTAYSYSEGNLILLAKQELADKAKSKEWVTSMMNSKRFKYNPIFATGNSEDTKIAFAQDALLYSEVAVTGMIRDEEKGKGASSKRLDEHSAQMNYMSMFSTDRKVSVSAKRKLTQAQYALTQVAEKNTQIAAVLPKMEYVLVEDKNQWNFSPIAQDHLFKMFVSEEQRIADQKAENKQTPESDKLGYLNTKRVYFEYLEGISLPTDFLENPFKYKDEIVKQILLGKKDTSGNYSNEGLLTLVDQYTQSVLDNYLTPGVSKDVLEKSYKENLKAFVADLVVNDFIWTNSYLQLMGMDLAIAKNYEDFVKRAALLIASGRSQNSDESTHVISYTKESIEYIDKNTFDRLTGDQKDNSNAVPIQIADAQVYSIPSSLLLDLQFQGADEKVIAAYKRLINPTEVITAEDGTQTTVYKPLTKDEVALLDLIPKKEVIAGVNYNSQTVYQKMAVAWLTKEMTSTWDQAQQKWVARPGYEILHNKREHLEKLFSDKGGNATVHLAPLSASKLYFPGNAFESNQFNTPEIVGNAQGISEISNKYRREQVINASKPKDSMVYSLQQHAISGSELLDKAGRELKAEQESAMAALRDDAFNTAANLIRVENADGTFDRADLEIFLESLRDQVLSTVPDSQLYEFLKSDGSGNFKYSSDLIHIAAKFEPLFLSTFKESFRNKIRGRKATLMSDEGTAVLVEINKEGDTINEVRVVTREEYDAAEDKSIYSDPNRFMTRRLNFMSLETAEEGKTSIKPAEVMMTRKTAEMMGINVTDPSRSDYMRVITTRIPTQNYHSIMPAVIADFLPEYYGDTIIGPKELVLMMGADFDVDALYTYMQDFWISNGKTVKYGNERNTAEKYEAYKYWNLKNNQILNDQVKKRVNADPRITEIKTLLNKKRQLSTLDKELQDLIKANVEVLVNKNTEELDSPEIGELILDLNEKMRTQLETASDLFDVKTVLRSLKSLNDLRQEHVTESMRALGMPGTFEEWQAMGSPASRGELYNRLFESNWKMFTQGSLWGAYKQYLNTDSIKNAVEKVKENPAISSKGIRLGNSIPSKAAAYKVNSASKALRGIVVSGNVAGLFMRENGVKLKNGITFVDANGDIKSFSEYPSIDPDASPEQILEHMKVIREISDTGSQMVGIVIDDPKEPTIWMLNWNASTLSEIADAISLGMPKDFVFKVFAMPIFSKLDSLMLLKSRAVASQSGSKSKVLADLIGGYQAFNANLEEILKATKIYTPERIAELGNNFVGDLTGKAIDDALVYNPKVQLFNADGSSRSNEALANEFANLTIEDLKKELKYHSSSMKALQLYDSLGEISKYRKDTLGKIASLNRQVGSSIEDVNEMVEAINLLDDEDASPFVNLKQAIYNSPNMAINIANIKKVQDYTELYFIKQTPFFKDYNASVTRFLSPFLKLKEKENLSRTAMSALVSHAVAVASNNKEYASLLEPGSENSMVTRYYKLMENPEFRDNPFVKWAFPVKYDSTKAKKYAPVIDTLSFDTFIKLDPNLNERIIDGHGALLFSSNPEIAKFGRDMFWYFLIKDGLTFKSESPGKFLTPESFEIVVNLLNNISKASRGNYEKAIAEIFNDSVSNISDRYAENMFRHRAFTSHINFVSTNNLLKFNPTGKKNVPLFKFTGDKGTVTLELANNGTPESINKHLKKRNIPIKVNSVVGGVSIDFPSFLAIESFDYQTLTSEKTRLKLVSSSEGKAVYKIVTSFGDYSNSMNLFYYTPEQNEKANQQMAKSSGYVTDLPSDIPSDFFNNTGPIETEYPEQFDSRPSTDMEDTPSTSEFEGNFTPDSFASSSTTPNDAELYEQYSKASAAEMAEVTKGMKKFIRPTITKDENFDPNDIPGGCEIK